MTAESSQIQAIPAMELDALFAPRPIGYLGADVALSIQIDQDRILWLFGDTLIGTLHDGRRQIRAMPRNTAAIQHGTQPDKTRIEWLFDPETPCDFLRQPDAGESWFWPGTGFLHEGYVYILGYEVKNAPSEWESLSFSIEGEWIVQAGPVSLGPHEWSFKYSRIGTAGKRDICACSASLLFDDLVYLLGMKWHGEHRDPETILARMAPPSTASLSVGVERTFLGREGWTDDVSSAAPIYTPGVTEASLYFDAPRARYLATCYRPRSAVMYIAKATSPEGPWSAPQPIFTAPTPHSAGPCLCYALRIHPHLAKSPDELVLSYVVNTRTLAALEENSSIYHPRFLRLDLAEL